MPDVIGDHYMLLKVERRGGAFSVVRKAIDERDESFVAVKLLSGGSDDLTRKVFNNEAKTLQSLAHPNIVRCRAAGMDDTDTYYLVLDWVERNLDDVLNASGPWESWDRLATDIALPLVDALAYTHLKQIEHRDIKPANVLISNKGVPLLADFGIAKIRGEEQTTSETVAAWHSKPYAPPELNADIRYVRDVYSVGVLLIQCMSKETLKDLGGVERALAAIPVPPDVRNLLASCIATQPDDRPRNASDLLGALKAIQQGAKRRSRSPATLFGCVSQKRPPGLWEGATTLATLQSVGLKSTSRGTSTHHSSAIRPPANLSGAVSGLTVIPGVSPLSVTRMAPRS